MKMHNAAKLNKMLAVAAVLCMVLAGLAMNMTEVFAAGQSKATEIVVPYTHIYDAPSSRTGDKFTYKIEAINGAPLPEGSSNGAYRFTVKAVGGGEAASDQLVLRIAFPGKGEYQYKVSSDNSKKGSKYIYETRTYTLNMYVGNPKEDGTSKVMITAVGDNGRKFEKLQFNPGYEAGSAPVRPITTPEGNGNINRNNGNNNTNNGTAANTTAAPAAAQPEETAEEPTPLEEMIDNVVPKANPERQTWALVNLLEAIASVVIALMMLWRFFERIDKEEDEYVIRRGGNLRLIGIIPAVVAVATFIGTEDIRNEMAMIDEMTAFMTGCLVVSIVFAALAYMKYNGHDGENTELSY